MICFIIHFLIDRNFSGYVYEWGDSNLQAHFMIKICIN